MSGCSAPRASRGCSPQCRTAMEHDYDKGTELGALIDDLGLEMVGVELDRDSAVELELGRLIHMHTDNINFK